MLFKDLAIGATFYLKGIQYVKTSEGDAIEQKTTSFNGETEILPATSVWSKSEENEDYSIEYGRNTSGALFLIGFYHDIKIFHFVNTIYGIVGLKKMAEKLGFSITFTQEDQDV